MASKAPNYLTALEQFQPESTTQTGELTPFYPGGARAVCDDSVMFKIVDIREGTGRYGKGQIWFTIKTQTGKDFILTLGKTPQRQLMLEGKKQLCNLEGMLVLISAQGARGNNTYRFQAVEA